MVGAPSGRWIAPMGRFVSARLLSRFSGRRLVPIMAKWSSDDLRLIAELMASGTVRPAIDRSYGLDEVAEAIRYLEQGHARGKVVIRIA